MLLPAKYGEVLDEPLTAEINGHTVSVKALLRGQYTLRILYDVDNARGMEGDDLVWDTANFTLYKPKGASERKWDYGASNVDVGPISGYAVGPWDGRYEASENDTLSCFVDIPLLYEKGNNRTLYIGDLTNYSAKASVKITLPDAPPTLTVDVKKTIALKGGHWFHYDMTDEEAEQYPDATFDIEEVRIEPLAVSVIGMNHGSLPLGGTSRYDVQSRVKLFRADGTELTYGWDGEFYMGQYGRITKNSGRTASYGLEASLRATPTNRLLLSATYGYTHATFQEYNDGKNDYKNNFVPFAPAHTLALSGAYTLPLDKETDLTFDLQYLGRGKIYWTEANDAAQNFYGLVNASIILSGKYADLKLWGKNLLNQHYQAFYFETMNAENLSTPNSFVQCGRPITFGADITIKF